MYDGSGERRVKIKSTTGRHEITYYLGAFELTRLIRSGQSDASNSLAFIHDAGTAIFRGRSGDVLPGESSRPAEQYTLSDHLGSASTTVDDTGAKISREAYTAYGESTYGSFEKKRYRFTGKERDEESGLNYHSARYYAPWLGKWLTPDPSGFVDGPNLYAYVRGNPVTLNDPTGNQGNIPLESDDGGFKGGGNTTKSEGPSIWETGFIVVAESVGWALGESMANAPGPQDKVYDVVSDSEYAARVALMVSAGAVGGVVASKVALQGAGGLSTALASRVAGGEVMGAIVGGGAVALDDFARDEVSPASAYIDSMIIGAAFGGVLEGTFALGGAGLASIRPKKGALNEGVPSARKDGDLCAGCEFLDNSIRNPPNSYIKNRILPTDNQGVPIPDSIFPHTQLGLSKPKFGAEPQAREWGYGTNGKLQPTRDIDFTDHGRPAYHPDVPHQHKLTPNNPTLAPKGGFRRGKGEPL